MIGTLLQIAGFACIVIGCALLSPIAAFFAAGVSLVLMGHAADYAGAALRLPRRKAKS